MQAQLGTAGSPYEVEIVVHNSESQQVPQLIIHTDYNPTSKGFGGLGLLLGIAPGHISVKNTNQATAHCADAVLSVRLLAQQFFTAYYGRTYFGNAMSTKIYEPIKSFLEKELKFDGK